MVAKSKDRRRVDKVSKDFVRALEEQGWSVRETSNGGLLAQSPDKATSFHVPKDMDSDRRASDQVRRQFARWLAENNKDHGITKVLDLVDRSMDALDDGDKIGAEVLLRAAEKNFDRNIDDNLAEAILGASLEHHEERDTFIDSVIITASTSTTEGEAAVAAVEQVIAGRTLVSSNRWLAHKSASADGGVKYESEAVIERHWSDNSVDYICALSACDFTSDKPRSVAAHYGSKHTASGEVEPASQDALVPGVDYVESNTHRAYNPSERLIAALAEYLEEHGDDFDTCRELAATALQWFHNRPDLDDVESRAPREPLTDAEIVGRIRLLVGQPLVAEVAELKAELERTLERADDLRREAAKAREERDAANARLVGIERDLAAAAALVQSIGRSA